MKPFSNILVPTDFSAPAQQALDQAMDLAARFGASVTLLHVYQLPMSYADGPIYGAELLDALEREAAAELAKEKARALQRATSLRLEPTPSVTTKLALGVPVIAIDDEVSTNGHDLVVIGTHGRTGLKRALMGSVAERVVRTASCPVLTVR